MFALLRAQALHEHEQCRDEGRAGAGRASVASTTGLPLSGSAFTSSTMRMAFFSNRACFGKAPRVISATMIQQKIARLAEDFAARLVGMFTAMPLDELVDECASRGERGVPVAARARVTRATSKKASASRSAAPGRSPGRNSETAPEPEDASPSPEILATALAFVSERGSRGATAHQVGEHLAALGIAGPTDVASVLARSGSIRDAGFRRAAGKNATAPVFVAT
jgi:hypothetical protein